MHPWKTDKNTETGYLKNAYNKRRHAAVLFVIVLNILLCSSVAVHARPTGLSVTPQNMINSSMPLWGGVQLAVTSQAEFTKEIKLHHFDDLECGSCHDTTPTANNNGATSDNVWKTGVDINRSCTTSGCHTYEESMNHPIGVTVNGNIPEGMETDPMSRITCITCHENSQAEPGFQEGDESEMPDRVLEIPDSQELCASCHTSGVTSTGNSSHWRFSNKAHLTSIMEEDVFQNTSTKQLFASVDEESTNCLSCHDEITAVIPAMNETHSQKIKRFRTMSDHPIGMNYGHKSSTDRGGFRMPMENSTVIRLFEGRVGCGSCHSLYSDKQSYLVQEFDRGQLCRSCHNK